MINFTDIRNCEGVEGPNDESATSRKQHTVYSTEILKTTKHHDNHKPTLLETMKQQVKPIGFEALRGGAYNNQNHLKLETPCS